MVLTPSVSAIIIMGVCGSGKSTLGGLLARATGLSFIEGDDLHPLGNIEKMSAGLPLTDADRWPWLECVATELEDAAYPGCIISCSALKRTYRDFIRDHVTKPVLFIMPETSHDILRHRLDNRPGHYMPPSLLDSQLAILERPDADEAVVMIDSTRAAEAVTSELLTLLGGRRDFAPLQIRP